MPYRQQGDKYDLPIHRKPPIFVLLDSDAQENYEQIIPRLRENDFVHVISKGEFEDKQEFQDISVRV